MRGNGRGRSYGRKRNSGDSDKKYLANRKERVSLESGKLVLLDQYMLASHRFFLGIKRCIDRDEEISDELIYRYGGISLDMPSGIYRLGRDPGKEQIFVYPDEGSKELEDAPDLGTVYLNTRCLALFDKELLDDTALLHKYREMWNQGDDKGCRDLLRDNGGAVRYGFSKVSDDLKVSAGGNRIKIEKIRLGNEKDMPSNMYEDNDSQDFVSES